MNEQPNTIQYIQTLINAHGLCMLPLVDGEKHHGKNWKQYQDRLPNETEILSWTDRKRWGIVCGKVSGNLEVIDFDEKVREGIFERWKSLLPAEGLELLKTLPLSKTINNGYHVLYRSMGIEGNTPLARGLNEKGDTKALIETRGEGGFIVEPPTEGYTPLNGSLKHIPEITSEQRRMLLDTARVLNEIVAVQKVFNPTSQPHGGNRPGDDYNARATWDEILVPHGWKVGLQYGDKKYWKRPNKVDVGISATENYNGYGLLHVFSTSTPFEPDRSYTKFSAYAILNHNSDFKSAAKELASKGYGGKQLTDGDEAKVPRESRGDKIVQMITEDPTTKIVLFHNEFKEPFLQLTVETHREIWACKAKMCRRWIARRCWQLEKNAPSGEVIKTALTVIEGKACFDGPMIHLANRVTEHEGAIWYDLADKEWRAVRVSKEGWQIISEPPILFRRYAHQKAQKEPLQDGDLKLLLDYLNVDNENKRLLLLVWVVACFIPNIPHPILIIYGAQGAAKTSLCRCLKRIGDPSELETVGFPKESNEFVQLLAHHWCVVFDNISHLSTNNSDALSKAVTGDGFSKRELYSDDDDVIYSFRRCIVINGINLVATKPDILERSILLELERVPEGKRRAEKEMLAGFEKDLPKILGGIFNVLQKAMQIEPTLELSSMPRMADFARWGCAISQALGYTQEKFLTAYQENINSQNDEVLLESLVAVLLQDFMDDKVSWHGTPTLLRNELIKVADAKDINVEDEQGFPRTSNTFGKQINELKTNLATKGLHIVRGEDKRQRTILIRKDPKSVVSVDVVAVLPPNTGTEAEQKPSTIPLLGPESTKSSERDDSNDSFWNPETF